MREEHTKHLSADTCSLRIGNSRVLMCLTKMKRDQKLLHNKIRLNVEMKRMESMEKIPSSKEKRASSLM